MDSREDRIVTIPNAVTLVRLACGPLFLWLLLGRDDIVAAGLLLSVLGATDWVDGYLARRLGQVSTMGKVLDPVADRILIFLAIIGTMAVGAAPAWFCLIVLVREVVVAGATLALAALGAVRIDVTWVGKAATFSLMFAFPFFLGSATDLAVAPVFGVLAWVVGIPGLLLAVYAAVAYVPLARAALREGRRQRQALGSAP